MTYQKSISRNHFLWLYNHADSFKKTILVSFALSVLVVTLSLLFVEVTRNFMVAVEKGENFSLLLLIVSLAVIKGCNIFCAEFKSYLREKQTFLMNNELSLKFFKKLFSSRISYNVNVHSGEYLSRITMDAFSVSNCIIGTIPELLYSLVQLAATCIYLSFIEPSLTFVIILIVTTNVIFGRSYSKKLLPISREIRICDSKTHQFMQEHLQHRELIITLEKISFIWDKLKSLQDILYQNIVRRLRLNSVVMFLIDGALDVSYIIIIVWGIYGIQHNSFTYAELVVFLQLAEQIQIPFIQFNHNYPMLVEAMASVERLMGIESLPEEDNSNMIIFDAPAGIRFSQVNFRYTKESNWVYRNFEHNFAPGSITAIVGETGAGKSTLLRLLLATLKPCSGSIWFYVKEVGETKIYTAESKTRGNCVYVPQGNSLISGTIRYNLRLGKTDASDEEMKNALSLAAADFVIEDFPNGLDTTVGEGGIGVSEGQAQRIAIARSFLRPGRIILMDEPTSALDVETEKLFLERLSSQTYGKTIIIVTHKQEICKYVQEVIKIEPIKN